MDNFGFRDKKKRSSVDGFISARPARSHSQSGTGDLSTFNQYYRPEKPVVPAGTVQQTSLSKRNSRRGTGSAPGAVRNIGAFHKSVEGFTPSSQAVISHSRKEAQYADVNDTFSQTEDEAVQRMGGFRAGMPARSVKVPKKGSSKRALFRRKKDGKKDSHAKHPKMKLGLRISAAFGVLLLLVGGGLALKAYLTSRGIFKGGGNSAVLHDQNVDPSQLKGEGDGRVNILVLGKGGAEQHDGPNLTDTIIIASIDPLAKEAALLSIPRDFWVRNQTGGAVKINQIYADAKQVALNKYNYSERDSGAAKDASEAAGINAIKQVVSETMGVPIHYYAMIDFAGFKKAIDTVGGIDINVTEDMAVQEQMWLAGTGNYYLNVQPGQQHFNGVKALAFSRSRKTSSRGDFARADRQRAVIVALKDKILTVGTLANPIKLNQLLSDFSGQLSTNFSVNELLRLYDLSKEIPGDKVVSVGLDEYVTGDTAMVGGVPLSVQVPKAGQFDYTDIQNYVRNIMRDAFLKREDAKLIVLNGTRTPGLATKKAKELKSYGYNVISVDDAPTDTYTQTVLVNLSREDKKYTLNYLQKRFNLTATGTLPDSSINAVGADFVIILGTDAQ